MARIRSIHPELFTDSAYMKASHGARLMLIGILCHSLDDGVFKWDPHSLAAKIFPMDKDIDGAKLLAELERLNFIRRFEDDQRQYGAVRNFQRYQSPRRPRYSGVLPDALRHYVAAPEPGPPGEQPEFPSMSEHVPPMSEHVHPGVGVGTGRGGGRGKGKGKGKGKSPTHTATAANGVSVETCREAMELWNATAKACGFAEALTLNDQRRKQLSVRLKEHGIDGFKLALSLIDKSSFLRGETSHGFTMNFDSLIRSAFFTKLLEGGFSDGNRRQSNRSTNGNGAYGRRSKADYQDEWDRKHGVKHIYSDDETGDDAISGGDNAGPRVIPERA